MLVREPVADGGFYPAGRDACIELMNSLRYVETPEVLPPRPVAGIVPHAGWVFSARRPLRSSSA